MLASAGSGGLQLQGSGAGQNAGPQLTKEELAAAKKVQQEELKKKRESRPVNYKKKAESKVNLGRSTLTDSRYWARIVEADMKQPNPDLRKASLGFNRDLFLNVHSDVNTLDR